MADKKDAKRDGVIEGGKSPEGETENTGVIEGGTPDPDEGEGGGEEDQGDEG